MDVHSNAEVPGRSASLHTAAPRTEWQGALCAGCRYQRWRGSGGHPLPTEGSQRLPMQKLFLVPGHGLYRVVCGGTCGLACSVWSQMTSTSERPPPPTAEPSWVMPTGGPRLRSAGVGSRPWPPSTALPAGLSRSGHCDPTERPCLGLHWPAVAGGWQWTPGWAGPGMLPGGEGSEGRQYPQTESADSTENVGQSWAWPARPSVHPNTDTASPRSPCPSTFRMRHLGGATSLAVPACWGALPVPFRGSLLACDSDLEASGVWGGKGEPRAGCPPPCGPSACLPASCCLTWAEAVPWLRLPRPAPTSTATPRPHWELVAASQQPQHLGLHVAALTEAECGG